MFTISAPGIDDDRLYDDVSAIQPEPARTRLANIGSHVKEAYADYVNRWPAAYATPSIVAATSPTRDDLISNYELLYRNQFAHVRSTVLRTRLCYACANTKAAEVDHFLPKDDWAEFSIFTKNLLPICPPCNRRKKKKVTTSDGSRAFIHPYMDFLPADEPYITADVEHGDTVLISYQVTKPQSVTDSTFEVLKAHFTGWQLPLLYATEATQMLSENAFNYELTFEALGPDGLKSSISRDAVSKTRSLGVNHWEPVALRALAEDEEFCSGGFRLLDGAQFVDA